MTYRPNLATAVLYGAIAGTSAQGNDQRFFGIHHIDLRASYDAVLDGQSHPLSSRFGSLAAAQARYPNAGLTSGPWASTEIDTAAWLQAEYDARTRLGSTSIIGLNGNDKLMQSKQLWLQDASKVKFHGLRSVILTEACGSAAAVRVDNDDADCIPALNGLLFRAFNAGRIPWPQNSGGVANAGFANSAAVTAPGASPGYRTGSVALFLNVNIHSVYANCIFQNFDTPVTFGNSVYCSGFVNCEFTGGNYGFNWTNPNGQNVMERIYHDNCTFGSNNTNVLINTLGSGGAPLGGSFDFNCCSNDYAIIANYDITGASLGSAYSNNTVKIIGGHIENNAATIGAGNPWVKLRSGVLNLVAVEWFYNGDATGAPRGWVEVGDGASGAFLGGRIGLDSVPLFYSSTTGDKKVSASGVTSANTGLPIILLSDANGVVFMDHPPSAQLSLHRIDASDKLDFRYAPFKDFLSKASGLITITLPSDSSANWAKNTTFKFMAGNGPIGFAADTGVTIFMPAGFNGGATSSVTAGSSVVPKLPIGTQGYAWKDGSNGWSVVGPLTT